MQTDPIFRSVGDTDDTFEPSGHARSPWSAESLHGGAPAALMARGLERVPSLVPMQVVRLSYDLLGPVPLERLEVRGGVEKEGRRTQLASVELLAAGRVVMRLSALRIRRAELPGVDPGTGPEIPGPDAADDSDLPFPAEGEAFHATGMGIRVVDGSFTGPGPATAWFRLRRPLVDDEAPTPLQRVAAAADFGNGVSWELPRLEYLFTNPDLTVHLSRDPVGEWVALDARTVVGDRGAGLAESVLHDGRGRLGRSAQSLYLDRL